MKDEVIYLRIDHAHATLTIIGAWAELVERPKPSSANTEPEMGAKL